MSWLVTAKQYIPAVIGEEFGGGYFAGYISHTADGNPTHALIVAPAATGATGTGYVLTTNLAWKTTSTSTSGANSLFDGAANTSAIVAAGIDDHPAAKFCAELIIDGFDDWYLPARYELDIAYFNLKPTAASNSTSWGINNYSTPARALNYTTNYPGQTFVVEFSTGLQAFLESYHWSSTEQSSSLAWPLLFSSGFQSTSGFASDKARSYCVRAFRRIAL